MLFFKLGECGGRGAPYKGRVRSVIIGKKWAASNARGLLKLVLIKA